MCNSGQKVYILAGKLTETPPFCAVSAINISHQSSIFQCASAIVNEMDLQQKFHLDFFSCFKLLKEGPCDMKCLRYVIFFWSMAVLSLH